MSFIRCLSNPEGLYVYRHVNGFIVIHARDLGGDVLHLSLRDWGTLKRCYRTNPASEINGKRLQVHHDIHVTPKGLEVDKFKWSLARSLRNKPHTDLKTRLRIKHRGRWRTLYLWDVTYHYLVGGAVRRDDWLAKRRTRPY